MFWRMATRVRELRATMTDAERRIWSLVRNRQLAGYKFRRQHPIGPFIADFVCIECRLIVELDGGQHADGLYDERRSAWLGKHGWRVVRFWNDAALGEAESVLQALLGALAETPSSATSAGSVSS
jgi:very-short-patch-repair endonuclease